MVQGEVWEKVCQNAYQMREPSSFVFDRWQKGERQQNQQLLFCKYLTRKSNSLYFLLQSKLD